MMSTGQDNGARADGCEQQLGRRRGLAPASTNEFMPPEAHVQPTPGAGNTGVVAHSRDAQKHLSESEAATLETRHWYYCSHREFEGDTCIQKKEDARESTRRADMPPCVPYDVLM